MQEHLENTIALLERTPGALDALLRGLPEMWVMRNEGGESWTAFDVVAHLIDADRVNWMPRARKFLEGRETDQDKTRPSVAPGGVAPEGEATRSDLPKFAAFDRGGLKRETEGKQLGELLDGFAALRAANLGELRGMKLEDGDLERRAEHPALGVVTLKQLLAAWAAHDLTHLHQISRIMAYQIRDAVGPWSKFLGVMQCKGHGE
jgi:DinB superfamily